MAMESEDAAPVGEQDYVPRTTPSFGPQVLAVYFGSRTCGFCSSTSFKSAMRRVGVLLERQAAAGGRSLHFVAVAVDWEIEAGFAYLRELGPFDEVSSGGKWWNTVVGQRLFGLGGAAVPTLVLYERSVTTDEGANSMSFGPERELARLVGGNVIESWIGRGAPITDWLLPVDPPRDAQATTRL